jgi:hypothetical protein
LLSQNAIPPNTIDIIGAPYEITPYNHVFRPAGQLHVVTLFKFAPGKFIPGSCPTPFGSALLFKIIPDDFVSNP